MFNFRNPFSRFSGKHPAGRRSQGAAPAPTGSAGPAARTPRSGASGVEGDESLDLPVAQPLSAAEIWIESGDWFSGFSSSNVRAISYQKEDERLLIEFGEKDKPSSFYAYTPVSPLLALALFKAPSKGTWVWDHLRVRGTVFGYQVPYEFLSGASGACRAWMRTQESRLRHGAVSPSGRTADGRVVRPEDLHQDR